MEKIFILSIFLFIIFCPISVYAERTESGTLSLQVQGVAKIERGNVAMAREAAIQNALKEAILETASQLSGIPNKDEDFQLIKNIIVREPDKYVFYYTVTEESRRPRNHFMVKTNVVVALLALKNDLHKMGFIHNNIKDKSDIRVFLIVKGLKNYSEYVRIKDFLQSRTKLVKNIYPSCFEWQEAHFEIDIAGSERALADELKKDAGYTLKISYPEHNRIEMVCW